MRILNGCSSYKLDYFLNNILSFHVGEYIDAGFQGYTAVYTNRYITTFCMIILSPSAAMKVEAL
jgi:hypothetical protein